MELDDLKASWKNETAKYSQSNKKDMEQLQQILKEKTSASIGRIKKTSERIISIMLVSMLVMVCIFPVISDGFTYPGSINGFTKLIFFYLLLLIFYWRKFRGYNHLNASDHIEVNLKQLTRVLKRNRRHELSVVILFFPVISITGRFFYGRGLNDLDAPGVVSGFILAITFTVAMVLLIKNRYNGQIREIEEYLNEYQDSKQHNIP